MEDFKLSFSVLQHWSVIQKLTFKSQLSQYIGLEELYELQTKCCYTNNRVITWLFGDSLY